MRYTLVLISLLFLLNCKKNSNPPPPVTPSTLTATAVSTSQINLSWTDNSTNEDGFKVERKTGSGTFAEVASVGKNTSSYSDGGLTKNTTYTYRVFAYNTGGKSQTYSNEASATTLDEIPATATNLTANAVSHKQINLAWEDKATNETGYKVERKTGANSFSVVASLGANTITYNDTGLTESTIYTYRIYPFNTAGNGANSNEAFDTTFADVVTGLVAYYPFTGNVIDSTVNRNDGTVNGAVSLTSDRFGISNNAYNFQGGTISAPHKSYLSIPQTGQFSISLWVNKTGNQNPVHIIGKRSQNSTSFNWQIAQHTTPGGLPGGGLSFTGVTNSTSTGIDYTGINDSTLQINKWEHLVGTYSNGTWNLYKNGKIAAQKISILYAPDTGNPPLEIGNCGGWGAFYGKIDDVKIYNRALSPSQIAFLSKQ